MPKPKSLTILGVRGLKVHERTPAYNRVGFIRGGEMYPCDAAVQAMLWRKDLYDTESSRTYDFAYRQFRYWQRVFDKAMARYEKENKR